MHEEIENVDRPLQGAVFQHDKLFNRMRHGVKRGQKHQDCQENKQAVRDFIKKIEHGGSASLKFNLCPAFWPGR